MGRSLSSHKGAQTSPDTHNASYPVRTRDSFSRVKSNQSMKLTTRLHLVHLVLRLRIYGIVPTLLHIVMSLCLINYVQRQIYPFIFNDLFFLLVFHPFSCYLYMLLYFGQECLKVNVSWHFFYYETVNYRLQEGSFQYCSVEWLLIVSGMRCVS